MRRPPGRSRSVGRWLWPAPAVATLRGELPRSDCHAPHSHLAGPRRGAIPRPGSGGARRTEPLRTLPAARNGRSLAGFDVLHLTGPRRAAPTCHSTDRLVGVFVFERGASSAVQNIGQRPPRTQISRPRPRIGDHANALLVSSHGVRVGIRKFVRSTRRATVRKKRGDVQGDYGLPCGAAGAHANRQRRSGPRSSAPLRRRSEGERAELRRLPETADVCPGPPFFPSSGPPSRALSAANRGQLVRPRHGPRNQGGLSAPRSRTHAQQTPPFCRAFRPSPREPPENLPEP